MLRMPAFVKGGGDRRTHMALFSHQTLGSGYRIVTLRAYDDLAGRASRGSIGSAHVNGCHQRHSQQTQCRKGFPWTNPNQ